MPLLYDFALRTNRAACLFLCLSPLPAVYAQKGSTHKPLSSRPQVARPDENAKPEPILPITIMRKPGEEAGVAQIAGSGPKAKPQKIASHAVAGWRARGRYGALIVVAEPPRHGLPKRYMLRYYDLDSGRRRELGELPFDAATLTETNSDGEDWAFALSGTDAAGGPVMIVGDDQAIPGRIGGATEPVFQNKAPLISYKVGGEERTTRLGLLLGTDLDRLIYTPPATEQLAPKYLQVFPTGDAMAELDDGSIVKGRWTSDGQTLQVRGLKAEYAVPLRALHSVQGIPAGQRFGVRMTEKLSSATTRKGDTVQAVVMMPVVVNGLILLPQGTKIEGTVVESNRVGWGFRHETASLTLHWTRATAPDGHLLELDARVYQVENAQEKVTEKGKIQGIRSTGTIGHSVENGVLTFAGIDPVAYIFASSSGSAVLGFAEPEILYPAGTELILEAMRPQVTEMVYPPSVLPMEGDDDGRRQLQAFVKRLPFRTRTKGSNKVSDITNLVFVGEPAALERAFAAAGWLPTDDLHASSTFKTVKTLTGNQTYTQAPMSVLLLDERAPLFTLSKTTNTFASRHHLRVFPTAERYDGQTVLTSSSTQDIGIAFSRKQKTFIHVIDQHIDNERSKVVNDLMFTGCVESLDMVQRPWVPRDAYNSTGDRLLTDGEAAVVRMNACNDPKTTPSTPALPPNRGKRIVRDTSLTIRNDVYRGNLIYQGIAGAFKVKSFLKESSELPPDTGAWQKTDASGADYQGLGHNPGLQRRAAETPDITPTPEDVAQMERVRENHKWDPPRYEFALHGGYNRHREDYLSAVGLLDYSTDPNKNGYFLFLADEVGDGWAAGGSVTVNSWRRFSNEFSYFRQQVKYNLGTANVALPPDADVVIGENDIEVIPVGMVTREFAYNLLFHPAASHSRWQPYVAAGPALQLIALNGAPLKHPAGPFTLGLKNLGLIKAAFDFGNTPPLDGGGIFRVGLQYGAGLKYRVTPRFMVRLDWRETWAKNPDIIADSYEDFDSNQLDETYDTAIIRVGPEKKYIQDRWTMGFAFTF